MTRANGSLADLQSNKAAKPKAYCKGDSHWTHQRPQDVPKGETHWRALHPEKVLRGERCSNAILDDASVREIRARVAAGRSQKVVAEIFHVSRATISAIVTRKRWAHVK